VTMPDLQAHVASLPIEDLPRIIGELVTAEEVARLRLRCATTAPASPAASAVEEDRLLTYQEAAQLMGVRASYVETLVRQRKIPTVALPGTDKAGQSREGRQKRIMRSSLLAFARANEQAARAGVR
jgi:excisionase family DNA binding protein